MDEVPPDKHVVPYDLRPEVRYRSRVSQGRDGARQVVLSFLREALDLVEDSRVEDVGPRVDQVRDDLGGFLRDRDQLFGADRDDPAALGPLALRDEPRRFPGGGEEGRFGTARGHVAAL